jgi:zinc protease
MYKILFLLITIVFIGTASVTAQKQTPPAGGKAKDFKLSKKDTDVYPNGLKTTLVQYGNIPKVTVNLVIKTGNMHEGPQQIWLANLTGSLMREGTANMNFAEISRKAAMMGSSLNINTGLTQTTISGSVLSEFAPEFIKLLAEIVTKPAFPASEIERLKSDFRRTLVTQKSVPQSIAQEQFLHAVYRDHRYGKTFPTDEMISSYTVDMVKDFYEKNFGAKRAVLYVVGSFDEKAVNAAIKTSLSKWKSGPDVMFPPVTVSATPDTLLINRAAAPQTTLIVGMPVITPDNKDYVPLLLTNSMLGGSFGSRITTNIRENKGYTYSPYSTISNRKGSTLWYEQADVTSEHTVNALLEIEKEIRRLQLEPPAKEELQGFQNYESGIFVLQNSSPNGIINQLNFLDLYGLGDSYLNNFVKNIHAITPEKISQMAKTYIQYDKMIKVLVGDKPAIQQQIQKQQAAPKAF